MRQMSAWWVRRSIKAVTQLALGKIVGQSLKARLVVMTSDFCAHRAHRRKKRALLDHVR
jgi:hypothetical protein